MSIQAIQKYHNEIEEVKDFSGETKEQSIKISFLNLLNDYCRKRNLLIVSEVSIKNKKGETIRPDGIIKNRSRFNCGYWESKANVNLEKEIELKINSGYPLSNTLFQDTQFAILYQNEQFVLKVSTEDYPEFDKLLDQFVSYEIKEIKEFNVEVENFKNNLPDILKELNRMIKEQEANNEDFISSQQNFFKICQNSINKNITLFDINEMLIQHILTEEIFISIFNDAQFHHENNIAKELYKVGSTFFKGSVKRDTLDKVKKYYSVIKLLAAAIDNHHDKQVFLKTIYEDFYKAYNPDKADTMGIVYTPSEIIKFQLESVETLLENHFKKTLSNREVKILDPCTGTGSYICDLIDHLPKKDLEYKFKNEIFANELGLLPYYIANLNIEYTYRQRMGNYIEFEHICWTDTLDNTGYLKEVNMDLFGLGDAFIENTERIKKQNEQKISVIIGNPPYNANQKNENDNNKNRDYYLDSKKKTGGIDGRISDTYIQESNAQKTKLYDPYARFYRWASDRISEEQGIISFVTNNSFIESKTFDGFRKCVAREFDFIYVINLGGDMRKNTDNNDNVFGITIGVALLFLVKTNNNPIKKSKLFYYCFPNCESREDKLRVLKYSTFENLESEFDRVIPDEKGNWINQTDNDFNSLIPVCSKDVKLGKNQNAIFSLYSNGVSTNRDEWVYDFSKVNLTKKMQFFFKEYNNEVIRWKKWKKESSYVDIKDESNPVVDSFLHERNLIKWSKMLKRDKLRKYKKGKFDKNDIKDCLYRPFVKSNIYYGYTPIDIKGEFNNIFTQENSNNKVIFFSNSARGDFSHLSSKYIVDLNIYVNSPVVCIPFCRYEINENGINIKVDNITDWALIQFKNQYPTIETLSKPDIFHYVYAVLHNPQYREKYELNLKRDFPRIPFYENFSQWAEYGKQLMDLHLNYETAEPYPLKRQDLKIRKIPKVKLKADKEQGLILIDDNTTLSEVPAAAWDYKLGNRSALEWILDQYKEKKPKDATIAEQFNTYRFADYKEQVIDLLMRVCTVSVETVRIVALLPL